MKKILFLLLVCLIKLNAYEYEFLFRNHINVGKYYFTNDSVIKIKRIYGSDFQNTQYIDYKNNKNLYSLFYSIKKSNFTYDQVVNNESGNKYIGANYFNELYKNDLFFLNDLLTVNNNAFLNYLYNNSDFNDSNYINYENYELLYNSDGLAVESILNGVWAGLYSDDEKEYSGKLYRADGFLLYDNGEEVSLFVAFFDRLTGGFGDSLVGCFYVLGNVLIFVLIVYFVWNMFYFVLKIGKSAINKKESV